MVMSWEIQVNIANYGVVQGNFRGQKTGRKSVFRPIFPVLLFLHQTTLIVDRL